jgi:antitoxin component YwqK of YwqJK toxin-antitoxin module
MFLVTDDKFIIDGPWHQWHKNGRLQYQATVKNGYTTGKSQSWDEKGMLIGERADSLHFSF